MLRLLAMTALLVSRERAVATLLLLLLVRGYSMSHRYTTRQSQEWSRDTAERGRERWVDRKECDRARDTRELGTAESGTCQDTMRNHHAL